jgi:dTMP kinase
MEQTKKGLFITFEGIDGCGKSTQAWMLGKYLASLSKYNHVVVTREPFKDANIRKMLTSESDPYSQGMKLAEMFILDRREHVSRLIMPFVSKGVHVISDRYSLSTLAYQQTQGVSLKKLLEMHKGLVIPDIIFIVDVPIKIAMKRMKKDKKRKAEQKFEKNAEFIGKLRQNYLDLANLRRHRIVVIDGRASPKKIFEKQIKPIIDKLAQEIT